MLKIALVLCIIYIHPASAWAFEGFGAGVQTGSTLYWVTNLNDSGPGSLRDALSVGNRMVRFAISGAIMPSEPIRVKGQGIYIAGLTAPFPGITLQGHGLIVRGTDGAHHVVVQGLRVRDAVGDGISISGGATNVVVDKVSVTLSGDGQVDVTEGSRLVTVSNSFLVGDKGMLIKSGLARQVTLHHNILIGNQRLPQVSGDNVVPYLTDVYADIRNNLIVEVTPPTLHGVLVWQNGLANVINNLFIGPRASDALVVTLGGIVHASGNQMFAGTGDPDVFSNRALPFPAPFVVTQSACEGVGVAIANQMWNTHGQDAVEAVVVDWLGGYMATLPPGQPC